MPLLRKFKTFALTVRRCRNWPRLVGNRLGLANPSCDFQLRNGLVVQSARPLSECWGQVFEPAVADIYGIENARPDMVWDVGGNMGAFSCLAGWAHPQATVHAFEPQEIEAGEFRANVQLNRLRNVILHQTVLTKDGREVEFAVNEVNRGASGLFANEGTQRRMPSVSPTSLSLKGVRALFIKLDCEGAEGELIEWVCENSANLPAKVWLACEYHPWCPVTLAASAERLGKAGFQARTSELFGETYLHAESSKTGA